MKSNEICTPPEESIFQEFPTLEIIPINKATPHEHHDPQRTPPLVEKLQTSGVMINPPLFSPFDDDSGEYMVLDGANRLYAFQEMGFPHILAQVVPSYSPSLTLSSWNHVIWDMASSILLKTLSSKQNITLAEIEESNLEEQNFEIVTSVHTPDDRIFTIIPHSNDMNACVSMLKDVMNTYDRTARFDRIPLKNVESVQGLYEDITAIVSYPQFKIDDIFNLCRTGNLLPSGITRFRVTPRALKVNYPLDELASEKPLEEKNFFLTQWLQNQLANKSVRFYSESTLIFDE
jgi:hypothetical protein